MNGPTRVLAALCTSLRALWTLERRRRPMIVSASRKSEKRNGIWRKGRRQTVRIINPASPCSSTERFLDIIINCGYTSPNIDRDFVLSFSETTYTRYIPQRPVTKLGHRMCHACRHMEYCEPDVYLTLRGFLYRLYRMAFAHYPNITREHRISLLASFLDACSQARRKLEYLTNP